MRCLTEIGLFEVVDDIAQECKFSGLKSGQRKSFIFSEVRGGTGENYDERRLAYLGDNICDSQK